MTQRSVLALGVMAALSGCTHSVHVNHTSDYRLTKPLEQYRVVKVEGEQRVILGFVTQTDYVDEAFVALQETCPGGQVTGIQTRYSTSHGFLSWRNVVQMKGYCSK